MFYVYILLSLKDGKFYTGCTNNFQRRYSEHIRGTVFSTKNRRPLKLVYYEACLNSEDAKRREKYLKTAWGKRYLKNRLKNYFNPVR